MRNYENHGEQVSPSVTAKERVEQFRKQFFKNITNQMPKQQQVNRKSYIHTNPQDRERERQKRSYTFHNNVKKTQPVQQVENSKIRSTLNQLNNDIDRQLPKKDKKMRRQFDVRIGNIEQITSKIEGLLQYVKKQKPKVQTTCKEDQTIQFIRSKQMQRIKSQIQDKNKNKYNNTEARKVDDYQEPRVKNQTISNEAIYLPNKKSYYDKNVLKNVQEKKSIIFDKDYDYQISYAMSSNRKNQKQSPKVQQEHQIKNKNFNYEYNPSEYKKITRTSSNLQNKSPGKVKNNSPISKSPLKTYNNPIGIDDQIQKIKNRIKQSQNERKKLEKSYAKYSYSGKQCFMDPKSNNQKSSLSMKQVNKHDHRPAVSNFQIKVYPCQMSQPKKQSSILAEVLSQQVNYDQKLREARQKFALVSNNQKWNNLKNFLEQCEINISIQSLKQELNIAVDQHNPFKNKSEITQGQCIEQIAQAYINSLKYWENNLNGCVNLQKLQNQGFSIKDIDLQKKGYLCIEDFVCFINLFSGNFYRNRDVMTLFKRFTKNQPNKNNKNKVEYDLFLQKVTKH